MKTCKSERGLQSYKKGLWAERLAILSLQLKGHRVLEKRYKTPGGGNRPYHRNIWVHYIYRG